LAAKGGGVKNLNHNEKRKGAGRTTSSFQREWKKQ